MQTSGEAGVIPGLPVFYFSAKLRYFYYGYSFIVLLLSDSVVLEKFPENYIITLPRSFGFGKMCRNFKFIPRALVDKKS
jgi:hypothetical protein